MLLPVKSLKFSPQQSLISEFEKLFLFIPFLFQSYSKDMSVRETTSDVTVLMNVCLLTNSVMENSTALMALMREFVVNISCYDFIMLCFWC